MSNGPELPPPGWYPDPENLAGPKRWWDGSDWTDRRRMDGPQPPPPGQFGGPGFAPPNAATPYGYSGDTNQFPTLDRAMSFGGRSLGANWLPLGVIELFCRVLPGLAFQWALLKAFDGAEFHEDGTFVAPPTPSWGTLGGTAAASVALGLVGFAIGISIVLKYLDIRGETGSASAAPFVGAGVRQGLRRLLPVTGWYILTLVLVWAAFLLIGLLTYAVPFLGVIAILMLIPAAIYLAVRFMFTGIAAVDGPGNPFARSLRVTHNRFWQVVGILIVAGLAIFLVNLVISVIIGIFQPPLLEPIQLADGVRFSANASPIGFVLQGILTLIIGVFLDGFGGGVGALLYRGANPLPSATSSTSSTSDVY